MSSVDQVARVLNVSPRRVQQLEKEPGFPPKLGRNDYDVSKIAVWFIGYLSRELERRGAPMETGALRAARLRLLREQANRIETENAVQRGELVEIDALRLLWSKRVWNCKQRMLGIPSGVGPTLTNKADPAHIAHRLRFAIEAALSELDGDAGVSTEPNGSHAHSP
jgi:phage terminase Nu1 subunit (DNA packaging protein)